MRCSVRRRAALWYPFSRALKLQGLRLPDADGKGRVANAQSDILRELRSHWAPVFQRLRKEQPSLRERYLSEHPVPIAGHQEARLPDANDLHRAAERARPSAP
eukprot:3678953-Pyramimonas_sp.AAC.1